MPSDRERWGEVQRLVDDALDLPVEQRMAFLERACADDPQLRAETARLLRACEHVSQPGRFLDNSAVTFAAPLIVEQPADAAVSSFAEVIAAASADRFEILRELGRGGMATVYLAHDRRHDRRVAVKALEQHLGSAGVDRFLREIRTTARLTHPHLLGLHDSGEARGQLYYVMPYVEGETLRARLEREGRLPVPVAVRLLRDVADALAYAHKHGVVHRDLKPENILLADGHAIVADFGVAKALAAAAHERDDDEVRSQRGYRSDALTLASGVIGTPAYMAPEQSDARTVVDHRADLYAFGVIAYEMLAGQRPYHDAIGTQRPAPPSVQSAAPGVPDALAALVSRLLANDPAARPASAAEVLRVLEQLLASSGQPPRWRRLSPRARPWAVLAALALVAIAGYAITARNAPRDGRASTMLAAAAPAVSIPSVAVLPFAETGAGDPYFAEGLTDELAHALARVPGMRVAGRTSSYAFKGQAVPAQQIGKALDVAAIITGSVRRAGRRVRVGLQLVSTGDGKIIWSSTYESRSNDVLAVQDDFTHAVVTALAPALGGTGTAAAAAQRVRGTMDQQAYELYLKGRYHFQLRGPDNVRESIRQYRGAVARDSNFARAHAGLALAYTVLPIYVPAAAAAAEPAMRFHARRAMSLDSTLADVQVAYGINLETQGRFLEAIEHHRKATQLEPENVNAYHMLGSLLLDLSRTEEAVAVLRRATQLDPAAKSPAASYGFALLAAGRTAESIRAARELLEKDSTFPLPYSGLAMAYVFAGQPDSALHVIERGRHNTSTPIAFNLDIFVRAAAGRWNEAEQLRRKAITAMDSAFAAYIFGDPQQLIDLLTTNRGQQQWRLSNYVLGCHPFLGPLWGRARFRTAMQRLGAAICRPAPGWPIAPPPAR